MILLPEAEADLAAARDWYERQHTGLGVEFLNRVGDTFRRIGLAPLMFASIHRGVRRAFVHRFPYIAYFRLVDDEPVILGVLHTRRDSEAWRSRIG